MVYIATALAYGSVLLFVIIHQDIWWQGTVQRCTFVAGFQHRAAIVQPPQGLIDHRTRYARVFAQLITGSRVITKQFKVYFRFVFGEADFH